jgi:hypothetical protein
MPSTLRSLVALACLLSCSDDPEVETVSCSTLPVEECADHEECMTLSAQRYDAVNACALAHEDVGCVEDRTCTQAFVFRLDADGQCWRFRNGCIPADFEQDDDICSAADFGSGTDC